MRCPYCGNPDTQVKDLRPSEDNTAIRRRRVCVECGGRFTTFERVQLRELTVLKRSGRRVPFDRDKLMRSVQVALRKRPVDPERVERMVSGIVRQLESRGERKSPPSRSAIWSWRASGTSTLSPMSASPRLSGFSRARISRPLSVSSPKTWRRQQSLMFTGIVTDVAKFRGHGTRSRPALSDRHELRSGRDRHRRIDCLRGLCLTVIERALPVIAASLTSRPRQRR